MPTAARAYGKINIGLLIGPRGTDGFHELRTVYHTIAPEDKLRIAAEVGSDLPLFAVGGAVLGIGHGEEVFPLPDLPTLHCVLATPAVAVSTPGAFASWDERKLTEAADSDRINLFSRSLHEWLSGYLSQSPAGTGGPSPKTGVPRGQQQKDRGDRAEALLLDLVRAGIENDFERVVFPEYPELREVKRALERNGARYSSLSGSGSALYGLFASADAAETCCQALVAMGIRAQVTRTLGRQEYWETVL